MQLLLASNWNIHNDVIYYGGQSIYWSFDSSSIEFTDPNHFTEAVYSTDKNYELLTKINMLRTLRYNTDIDISYDRIGYLVYLETSSGNSWTYTEFDRPDSMFNVSHLLIPSEESHMGDLDNLMIFSKDSVHKGPLNNGPKIKFTPYDYTLPVGPKEIKFADPAISTGGYGCMQIWENSTTVTWAYNKLYGHVKDIGIGNYSGAYIDWSNTQNSNMYTHATMYIFGVDNLSTSTGIQFPAIDTTLNELYNKILLWQPYYFKINIDNGFFKVSFIDHQSDIPTVEYTQIGKFYKSDNGRITDIYGNYVSMVGDGIPAVYKFDNIELNIKQSYIFENYFRRNGNFYNDPKMVDDAVLTQGELNNGNVKIMYNSSSYKTSTETGTFLEMYSIQIDDDSNIYNNVIEVYHQNDIIIYNIQSVRFLYTRETIRGHAITDVTNFALYLSNHKSVQINLQAGTLTYYQYNRQQRIVNMHVSNSALSALLPNVFVYEYIYNPGIYLNHVLVPSEPTEQTAIEQLQTLFDQVIQSLN
jgi:hypothetical protein